MYACTYTHTLKALSHSPGVADSSTHVYARTYVPGVLLFSWAKRVGSKVEVKVCGCIASEWRMVAKDMAACPCTSTGAALTTVYKCQETQTSNTTHFLYVCECVCTASCCHGNQKLSGCWVNFHRFCTVYKYSTHTVIMYIIYIHTYFIYI